MQTTDYNVEGSGIFVENSKFLVDHSCEFRSNANSGIYAISSSMTIRNNTIEGNGFGVLSTLKSFAETTIIDNNEFINNELSSISIDRGNAAEGQHNSITNNVIEGGDGTDGWAEIRIHSNGVSEDDLLIALNEISFDGKTDPSGIDVLAISSNNCAIVANTININNDDYANGGFGIRLYNFLDATGTYVFQNTVEGDGSNEDEGSRAIEIHGRNANICANDVKGFSYGLSFISTCDNSLIGQNHIDSSFVGLKATGVLSEQLRRANTWATEENAFGLYAAQHTDPDLAEMSSFIIHSSSSQYSPDPFTPAGWFDSDYGSANICANTLAQVVFTSFDSTIATVDLFNSAGRTWSERRILMHKLLMNPELRADSGNFFDDGLDSVYGQFAIVDTLIRNSVLSFRDEETLIDSLSLSINDIILDISYIDSIQEDMSVYGDSLGLISDSLASVKFGLLDSISELYDEVLTTRETVTASQRNALLGVLEVNDAITTYETWQDAQMVVNRYRIRTLLNEPISENGLDSLREIAAGCLVEMGSAVYLALKLLPYCEWSTYPDPEDVLCPGESEKRLYEIIDQDLKVTLFPIPASETVTVSFNKDFSGLFELFTVDGVCIYRNQLMDQTNFTIHTSQIQNGTYSWRIKSDSNILRSGLVVIAR